MRKKKEKKIVEKHFSFNLDNKKEAKAVSILDKAGRKKAKLIGIMALEFAENFGIADDISEKELNDIISLYDTLKKMKGVSPVIQNFQQPYSLIMESPAKELSMDNKVFHDDTTKSSDKTDALMTKSEDKREQPHESESKDFDELKRALSGFMDY